MESSLKDYRTTQLLPKRLHLYANPQAYSCMARTTLVIDDVLLHQIKRKAADEGRTFQAVANELLRQALPTPPAKPYRLKWKGWKAELQPGVDISNRDSLYDFLDKE